MKIALIAFTQKGANLCNRIGKLLLQKGNSCKVYAMGRANESDLGLLAVKTDLTHWTKTAFEQNDAIIFVGATGIAVRAIAPFVQNKAIDPAIICIDELGVYVIPLLSGHIGGANELADEISNEIGARAVITTATDINDKFAIDSWATKNKLYIDNMNIAKEISSSILNGQEIGLCTSFPVNGKLPVGVTKKNSGDIGFCVMLNNKQNPFEQTLHLIPKIISVGIGCKKNTPMENMDKLLNDVLSGNNISPKAIEGIYSIDIKKAERGIKELCEKYKVQFKVFSAIELSAVAGEFTTSEFVQGITGVDNVCERAALRGSKQGTLLVRKKAQNGVTIAIAVKDWSVCFEG